MKQKSGDWMRWERHRQELEIYSAGSSRKCTAILGRTPGRLSVCLCSAGVKKKNRRLGDQHISTSHQRFINVKALPSCLQTLCKLKSDVYVTLVLILKLKCKENSESARKRCMIIAAKPQWKKLQDNFCMQIFYLRAKLYRISSEIELKSKE